jgi:hypothetical protein
MLIAEIYMAGSCSGVVAACRNMFHYGVVRGPIFRMKMILFRLRQLEEYIYTIRNGSLLQEIFFAVASLGQ